MASNVSQLRRDIDRGRTVDKVSVTDPASAPLGTDDEAAGTPPSPREVDIARENELRLPESGDRAAAQAESRNNQGTAPAVLIFGLVLALVVFTVLMLLILT